MKILIIGNGFDLASGLPTDCGSFFYNRFNILKSTLNEMDMFLKENFDIGTPIDESLSPNHKDRKGHPSFLKYISYKNNIEKCFTDTISDINFWDLYFWFTSKFSKEDLDM